MEQPLDCRRAARLQSALPAASLNHHARLARPPPCAEARFISDAGREAIQRYRTQLLGAAEALDALLAPAQCPALVQAIVQVGAGPRR